MYVCLHVLYLYPSLGYCFMSIYDCVSMCVSGGSRNLERGVYPTGVRSTSKNVGCHAHFRSRWSPN